MIVEDQSVTEKDAGRTRNRDFNIVTDFERRKFTLHAASEWMEPTGLSSLICGRVWVQRVSCVRRKLKGDEGGQLCGNRRLTVKCRSTSSAEDLQISLFILFSNDLSQIPASRIKTFLSGESLAKRIQYQFGLRCIFLFSLQCV